MYVVERRSDEKKAAYKDVRDVREGGTRHLSGRVAAGSDTDRDNFWTGDVVSRYRYRLGSRYTCKMVAKATPRTKEYRVGLKYGHHVDVSTRASRARRLIALQSRSHYSSD